MPTIAERLASLEVYALENRRRLDEIHAAINSGPGVEWNQSIRGRLHTMRNAIEAADKLADAATELRREQEHQRRTKVKTWQWSVIAVCALVAAATPYVLLLTH